MPAAKRSKRGEAGLMGKHGHDGEEWDDDEGDGEEEEEYDQSMPDSRPRKATRTPTQAISAEVVATGSTGMDDGHDEDEAEGQFESNMSQIQSQDADVGLVDMPAESGIVKALHLVNFMCHRMLEIKFADNINFINGVNGSGKSAILSALVLGLGAQPTNTGRGSTNVSSFIRNGARDATIRVSMKNSGSEAFKPEIYGDVIHVERVITKKGSTYTMYDANNNKKATSRRSVLDMCDHFNIQIDNPVSILTQEVAKTFLTDSSPTNLFKFFKKGTHVETLEHLFVDVDDILTQSEYLLERKTKEMKKLEVNIEADRQRYELTQKIDEMEQEEHKLVQSLVWAEVKEKRSEIEDARNDALKFDDDIRKCTANLEKIEAKKAAKTARMQELEAAVSEMKGRLDAAEQQATDIRHRKRGLAREQEDAKRNLMKCERELRFKREEAERVLQTIGELEHSNNADAHDCEARQRAEKIAEKEEQLQQLHHARQECEQAAQELDGAQGRLHEVKDRSMQELERAKYRLDSLERERRNLIHSGQSQLSVWGQEFPVAAAKIDRERFSKPVYGPIGQYIRLQDKTWGVAVETSLRNFLPAYLVDNAADAAKLKRILASVFRRHQPSVYVYSYANAGRKLPPVQAPAPTIDQVTSISEPVVEAFLVDHGRTNITFLCKDYDQGRELVWDARGASQISGLNGQRIAGAFLPNGDEMRAGAGNRYYSNSSTRPVRLGADVAQITREIEAKIPAAQEKLEQAKTDLANARRQIADNEAQSKERERQLRTIVRQQRKLERSLNALRQEDELEEPVGVADLQSSLHDLEQELQPIQNKREELSRLVAEYDSKMRDFDAQNPMPDKTALLQEMEPYVRELDALPAWFAKYELKENKSKERLEQAELEKQAAEVHIQNKQRDLQEVEQSAIERGLDEISTTKSSKRYRHELQQIQARIARSKQASNIDNIDEFRRKFHEAQQQFDEAKNVLECVKGYLHDLVEARNRRKDKLEFYVDYHFCRMRTYFQRCLQHNGFSGKLDFEKQFNKEEVRFDGKLHLTVLPAKQEANSARSTKSLSGGEKSFSTLAFLMSLWDVMQCPFTALDEFDVFMDMMTRSVSVDLLLALTRMRRNKQLFILSPLKMGQFQDKMGDGAQLHRLNPPDRHQGTLNFSSQP
ncbi:hypothetical protein PTSG_02778 [Salpingoeca rosetta]|uniref:RecF/RecN/SMC N-terminal domain-containing protein n=1 Tax=Salpingoeca rosetta (strain ATCC 50818 / BSB-021) TaxID=946362 RepID=F2U3A4_SALR5|nr:uncharacterized protein PTSG_02778 [Salpingoeca rosetta]EGD82098.1 hypothetical protein PTSG_02778 [Salpingoeca rosetta]|eukprot:XP_004996281.1 hypothetical protein PTSG_02778 [Salpingoeca rosetta]